MKSAKTDEWVSEDKISDTEGTKVEECGKSEIERTESGTDIGQAVQTIGHKLQEGKKFSALKVMDSLNMSKEEFKSEQLSCDRLKWVRQKANKL